MCSLHSSPFIYPRFLSFCVSIFSYVYSIEEYFGSSANNSNRKINLSEFEFLVKNNFSWKIILTKQRFKRNKIGSWHTPTKHKLSHNTVKISSRKAISSSLYITKKNSIYFNKYWKSLENVFLCKWGGWEVVFQQLRVHNFYLYRESTKTSPWAYIFQKRVKSGF